MNKVTFYIPGKIGSEIIPINSRLEIINLIVNSLATKFGGATSFESVGYWKDSAGQLVVETITQIYSFYNAEDPFVNIYFEAIAKAIKTNLKQDSVLYTVETNLITNFI